MIIFNNNHFCFFLGKFGDTVGFLAICVQSEDAESSLGPCLRQGQPIRRKQGVSVAEREFEGSHSVLAVVYLGVQQITDEKVLQW